MSWFAEKYPLMGISSQTNLSYFCESPHYMG